MKYIFLGLLALTGCASDGQKNVTANQAPAPAAPKIITHKIDATKIKSVKDVADILEALNLNFAYPEGDVKAKESAEKLKRLFK